MLAAEKTSTSSKGHVPPTVYALCHGAAKKPSCKGVHDLYSTLEHGSTKESVHLPLLHQPLPCICSKHHTHALTQTRTLLTCRCCSCTNSSSWRRLVFFTQSLACMCFFLPFSAACSAVNFWRALAFFALALAFPCCKGGGNSKSAKYSVSGNSKSWSMQSTESVVAVASMIICMIRCKDTSGAECKCSFKQVFNNSACSAARTAQ